MARRHDTAYDADRVSCSCGWRTSRKAFDPGSFRRLAYAYLAFPDVPAEALATVLSEKGDRP